MSYPSLGKPASCELNSSDPLYANIRAFVSFHEGQGPPRELKSNLVAQPSSGMGGCNNIAGGAPGPGIGVGRYPTWATSTGLAVSFPTMKWGHNGKSLGWVGTGYGTGTKRTLFGVFRIPSGYQFPYGTTGGQQYVLLSGGANGGDGALVLTSTSGTTATLGMLHSNSTIVSPSSALTLTIGTWYAVAVSSDDTSTKNRLFQVYDYGAQALLANSGGVAVDSSAMPTGNRADMTVMSYGISGAESFPLEVACCGLHNDYWDTSTNNLFPGFYQDPFSVARGTYTASGSLAAGSSGLMEATRTQVFLGAGRASGIGTGGTGSPTYQWFRSQQSNDTPGSGTMPALAGATSLYLADTPPASSGAYFYKLQASDGSSTVTYPQVPAVLSPYDPIKLALAGDSITNMASGQVGSSAFMLRSLASDGRMITCVNMGVFGSMTLSGTAAVSWDPTSGLCLPALKNAMAQEGGITWVFLMLGSNDASTPMTAAGYQTNLNNIVSNLITAGYNVCLHYPPYCTAKGDANNEALRQYQGSIQAVVNSYATTNPGRVVLGDTANWAFSVNNPRDFADGLHPTSQTGGGTFGENWAKAVRSVFGPSGNTTYSGFPRSRSLAGF